MLLRALLRELPKLVLLMPLLQLPLLQLRRLPKLVVSLDLLEMLFGLLSNCFTGKAAKASAASAASAAAAAATDSVAATVRLPILPKTIWHNSKIHLTNVLFQGENAAASDGSKGIAAAALAQSAVDAFAAGDIITAVRPIFLFTC